MNRYISGNTNGHNTNGSGDQPNEEEHHVSLKVLMTALYRHKWFISGTIVVCMALAFAITLFMTPIYESEGSLMISQSEERSSSDSDDELTNLLNKTYGVGAGSTTMNELHFLRSRKISEEMADKILETRHMENGELYPILWRDYPEDSTLAARDSVAARIRDNISILQEDEDSDLIRVSFQSPSNQEAADIVNLAMNTYTDLSTDENRTTASSAVEFLEEERQRIQEKVSESEQALRDFMNTEKVVEVDAQTDQLITRISELESEQQSIRVNLVAVNSAIEEHEERLNQIRPGLSKQYSDAVGPLINRYQYQLAELETERMMIISKNPGVEDRENPPAKLQELDNQIQYIKNQIEEKTGDLTSQGDQFLGFLGDSDGNVSENIDRIHEELVDLKVQKRQYEAQEEALAERIEEEQAFFDKLPDNIVDLASLRRDHEINEQTYRDVSEQYSSMVMWQQTQFGLGRVLDEGFVPTAPAKPQLKLYLLAGFLLGGILSVGYLVMKNSFNATIDGTRRLKAWDYPVVAVIPTLEKATRKKLNKSNKNKVAVLNHNISPQLISVLDPISPGTEAFRRLHYNVVYSQAKKDQSCKTILVTSSSNGEGKTTAVSNMGVVLAESKKKVIIVDTDLGRPNLHNMFGISRAPGLVDVIRGEVKLGEAIQTSKVVSGVDVLTSGSRSLNPPAVIQNPKFEYLLQHLNMQYDYVLIDTAPYGIVTDAAPVMKMVDGVVVVVRFKKTKQDELDYTVQNLRKINVNILGFVLTDFDPEKSSDYYYGSDFYNSAYKNYYSHNKNVAP